jgi:thiamine transport system ATP-binding protein
MLTLEQVEVRQNGFTLAADFQVEPGAIVAVIGPSGAGKSTLLNVIAGFVAPAAGRVLWDGADITGTPPGDRPLSVIFQDNNLFPHLTAFENVALGLKPSLRLAPGERDAVAGSLARVGLGGLGDRKPGQLSGGQQSRVALARMLLRHRPLALLDEPFSALGPALRDEMLGLVTDLAAETGMSLMIVTHEPRDAQRIADRTVLVAEGVAAAPVATAALFEDPPEALRDYLGAGGG